MVGIIIVIIGGTHAQAHTHQNKGFDQFLYSSRLVVVSSCLRLVSSSSRVVVIVVVVNVENNVCASDN